jgi:hypothetical protein
VRYRLSIAIVLFVLVGATIYEALVALGVIDLGALPGEGPPGEGLARLLALVAVLVGAAIVVAAPLAAPGAFLAPAAGAFLLARFYTFDPYYLPTLRRMSDQGLLSPLLVYSVVAVAIAVALVSGRWPGVGRYLGPPIALAASLLAFAAGGGH